MFGGKVILLALEYQPAAEIRSELIWYKEIVVREIVEVEHNFRMWLIHSKMANWLIHKN